jgi:hypothetical protein
MISSPLLTVFKSLIEVREGVVDRWRCVQPIRGEVLSDGAEVVESCEGILSLTIAVAKEVERLRVLVISRHGN